MGRFLGKEIFCHRVTHPNVCRVYDIAEHEGRTFLSMEYVDGEDLVSLLRKARIFEGGWNWNELFKNP